MANTYSQIHIQAVFAVHGRLRMISKQHKEELQKYITGIIQGEGQKLLAVNCMPDHTHIFFGLRPQKAIADLLCVVKAESSRFVTEKGFARGKFAWQEGYGAFSYCRREVDTIVRYVMNQEEHHRRTSFKEEYLRFLREFQIPYDERYLFQWIDGP
jgi:REP element-mobilizing transposase RayT